MIQPISQSSSTKPSKVKSMVSSFFICGSSSLTKEDEKHNHHYQERASQSASSTPRRSSSKWKASNQRRHQNPYANRGLDKFSALLADVDEKKRIIYSQNNPDEICFVRFDFSKDNNCRSIVIKVKPEKYNQEIKTHERNHNQEPSMEVVQSMAKESKEISIHRELDEKSMSLRRMRLQRLRKPSNYLAAIVIMILMLLTLSGRSIAILFTSMGWYAIPAICNRSWRPRRCLKKRKEESNGSFKGASHGVITP